MAADNCDMLDDDKMKLELKNSMTGDGNNSFARASASESGVACSLRWYVGKKAMLDNHQYKILSDFFKRLCELLVALNSLTNSTTPNKERQPYAIACRQSTEKLW